MYKGGSFLRVVLILYKSSNQSVCIIIWLDRVHTFSFCSKTLHWKSLEVWELRLLLIEWNYFVVGIV